MRSVLLLSLLAYCLGQNACPAAPATPADRRANRSRLRLATFNVEWLFPGNDGKSPWTIPQAEQHLTDVSVAISQLNADVLALQEVYDCTMLGRLIEKLDKLGATGYKPYLVKGTDTATQQNVALITRVDPISNLTRSENRVAYPIAGNTCGNTNSNGTSAVSKHFIARFNISGVTYTFFNHHFLAFPTQADRCVQREAQAQVMRGLINSVASNDQIVAFGDYNDYSDAVLDSANSVPTSRVMKYLRQGITTGDRVLYEVSNLVAKANRYTSAYDVNKVSMIDHLLVSTGIQTRITGANVAFLYPRETTSDHWPFWVDIST